jgi:hypothetical protein
MMYRLRRSSRPASRAPRKRIAPGLAYAFILDTLVTATARRRGIGKELVVLAAARAREAGCEWLHVDFDDGLGPFYFGACGFRPTNAGLIAL